MRHFHLIIALVGCLLVADTCVAQQQGRGRRLVEGLLRTFIESQLPSDPPPQGRPVPPPTTRPPSRAEQPSRPVNPAATPEMQQAAQILSRASNEMAGLVGAMQGDLVRAPGVRQLMTLAFRVNSDAATLSRRLARGTDLELLREPLRKLDQDWHTLEYRLGQIPNLSRATLGHLEKIRRYEAQLATMFEVPTQVDLIAVSEQAAAMNSSLRNLLDDIRYEVTDTSRANRLLQQGRDTYDNLQQFIDTTRSPSVTYERLTEDFKALEKEWVRYERRLRNLNNRFIQRQAQRVTDATRNIHQLLYLEVEQVDRADLAHSMRLIQHGTDQLLDQITLRMLTEIPAARRFAIESASDFYTTCQDTLEVIQAGDDLDVVREMFMHTHDEWERLSLALQGIRSQKARQAMRDVGLSLNQLQSQLGIQFGLDRQQAIELSANLAGDARHLQEDIREIFGRPNRYPQSFQSGSLQAAAQFRAAAADLQTQLSNGDKLQQLKTSCDRLSTTWNSLDQYIPRFSSAERSHLEKMRREVTPQVIQMQTMLSL